MVSEFVMSRERGQSDGPGENAILTANKKPQHFDSAHLGSITVLYTLPNPCFGNNFFMCSWGLSFC